MATRKARSAREAKPRADNAFLKWLKAGPLSFGQLLAGLRDSEGQTLEKFASRLRVSRQHLHQLEAGRKRVSPERAVRFARVLGHSEIYFLQLALQDLINDAGVSAKVEVTASNTEAAR
jgi:transcriptional regulator with XRE-family HTH domain